MAGLKVKHDCFAYNKYSRDCHALGELVCLTGECKFYKTEEQRCKECEAKKDKRIITCEECMKKGIKKAGV